MRRDDVSDDFDDDDPCSPESIREVLEGMAARPAAPLAVDYVGGYRTACNDCGGSLRVVAVQTEGCDLGDAAVVTYRGECGGEQTIRLTPGSVLLVKQTAPCRRPPGPAPSRN